MIELKEDECEAVSGGGLEIHCCSLDIGIVTIKWDAFVINTGAGMSMNYSDNLRSAYNRL
ncbi:hypothetical protein [Alteromonas sp. CYL-A6]|uniref:hypothetical protein n=1 Tax=Alteromonas nitratireducens TaxID=3390813 RepID=UPI0034B5D9D9